MSKKPFNTGEPIAYFITWTCYGTWLPGDERGSWRGEEFTPPNLLLADMTKSAMKETPFLLSPNNRELVAATIARHCMIRGWTLHAVNVRTNHVHVVAAAPGVLGKDVHNQLKAWCTRCLKPSHPGRERFWTEGGSCRWINMEADLDSAILYVKEHQDRKH